MRQIIKYSIILIVGIVSLTSYANSADENLKTTLDQAWSVHIAAYESGNVNAVKESMSSVAFGTMMNSLRDAKKELTQEMMLSLAKNTPDISQMKFVKT